MTSRALVGLPGSGRDRDDLHSPSTDTYKEVLARDVQDTRAKHQGTEHALAVYKQTVLRGLVSTEHLYPFAIVEIPVAVCKGPLEELVDLDGGEWRGRAGIRMHLLLVHAFADVAHPLAELVGLDGARVCLVETLERVRELCVWAELGEALGHHGEEHGEVDAGGGRGRGRARACGEEVVEHGLGGGDAWGGVRGGGRERGH